MAPCVTSADCGSGLDCLAGACLSAGAACTRSSDCGASAYCELALGSDAGPGGSSGSSGACTEPPPANGKCLPLPTTCGADGGAPDAGCLATCEVHPVASGTLNAVARWSWGPTAAEYPNYTDVWSTPTVGRLFDSNCDGVVDANDAPDVVFVSGKAINPTTGLGTNCQSTNSTPDGCHTGVLRMLDGRTGAEIWSLNKASPTSVGFAGVATALGDIDGDGRLDILAVTGEGYVVLVNADGQVVRQSDQPIPGNSANLFGWGGALAVADMDGDGFPEIAYGATVFTTTNNAITLKFTGTGGVGGGSSFYAMSTFVDLDGAADGHLELLAGNTAYQADGTPLWHNTSVSDGLTAVADFSGLGKPQVALVANGQAWILDGATGSVVLGPVTLPGTGTGGAPAVADFDGDGHPEIGVAKATAYSVLKPNFVNHTIDVLWSKATHDLGSSVTGSVAFDFEGDGKAEVVYSDECFFWVFDGATGAVRFATSHTSFTSTESPLVADVDGDGRAELLMVSTGADPSASGWKCLNAVGAPVTLNGVTWTPSSAASQAYRGITAFGDRAGGWVGARALWNEATYHVTNICDDGDDACGAPNLYGSLPLVEKASWLQPWDNAFRQSATDRNVYVAADATVWLSVDCTSPAVAHAWVRNLGQGTLPAGTAVGVYVVTGSTSTLAGQASTTRALGLGQTERLDLSIDPSLGTSTDAYLAQLMVDPLNPTFAQCRADNDASPTAVAICP